MKYSFAERERDSEIIRLLQDIAYYKITHIWGY